MIVQSKLIHGLFIVALTVVMSGCGSSKNPTPLTPAPMGQSGRLVQGPVTGATLFADNVSGGVRFTLDAGEASTKTDATTGNFILPSVPGYNYILVSKGGTDKLTGLPAMQMLAPAGSANVTPLTTLVALDTTGTVKAKLEALMTGGKYDTDISTTASPAILLVAKSVETIVQTITSAITASAAAGSNTISSSQMASIQAQTMKAIAVEFAKTTVTAETLSEPDNLTTTLQTATTTAATSINAANTNITISAATATAIATSAVSATATAFALGVGDTALITAITGGENAVMTQSAAQFFLNAVNDQSITITATTTPTIYTPPTIVVVTPITVPDPNITGATGGSSDGTGVNF
jgi:hypothetical protein